MSTSSKLSQKSKSTQDLQNSDGRSTQGLSSTQDLLISAGKKDSYSKKQSGIKISGSEAEISAKFLRMEESAESPALGLSPRRNFPTKAPASFEERIFSPPIISRRGSIKDNNNLLRDDSSKQVDIGVVESTRLTKAEKKERKSKNKMERLADEGKTVQQQKKKETALRSSSHPDAVPKNDTLVKTVADQPISMKQKKKAKSKLTKSGSLFLHLDVNQDGKDKMALLDAKIQTGQIHPAIHSLGLKYSNYSISGGNARCFAMLMAFKKVIADYTTPPELLLSRHLTSYIGKQIDFLNTTRSLATSMKTAIRYVKNDIATLSLDKSDEDAKAYLLERIDLFVNTRITCAMKVISDIAVDRIEEDDVILTFSSSSLVHNVLKNAQEKKIKFRVIVIDSRPRCEGKKMLLELKSIGIPCTYMMINAIGIAIQMANKVIISANSVMSNGAIMARAGTASVCMMAKESRIPVIVVAESYKFTNIVRLDSFAWNELGSQEEVIDLSKQKTGTILSDWASTSNLNVLNLNYDLTPSKFITMLISEVGGCIPSTSAGAILRELSGEIGH